MALPHPCHTQSRASIPQVKVTKKEAPPLGCRCMWFSLSNQFLWARWGTLKSCLSWEERPLTGSWKESNVLFLSYSNLEWSLIIAELGEIREGMILAQISQTFIFSIEWTRTWANSRRWWGTAKHGVLKSMGLWIAKHDWVTEKQKKKNPGFSYIFLNRCFFIFCLPTVLLPEALNGCFYK